LSAGLGLHSYPEFCVSIVSAAARTLSTFEELVREGEGRVLGHRVLELWGSAIGADDVGRVLQLAPHLHPV
jgi:hypothetical protein